MKKFASALLLLFFGIFLAGGTAIADTTEILDAPAWEVNLTGVGGVLDQLYGWNNLKRINDDFDQIWNPADGNATAKAKYAAYGLELGYIRDINGFDIANFETLFTVNNPTFDFLNDPNLTGQLTGGGNFIWSLKTGGATSPWTSQPDQNGNDHMVTWLIGGDSDAAGNYVIAWEDQNNLGDRDFNDLVVEVSGVQPVPIPAAILLLGSGLIGLVGIRRKIKL